ncbi:uncharacterized protein [Phyllobates terribilis]|uniref:uncharacterized protein n=1 Tax=Phyllobates terribilis TaxID=111132 RepID=UPI003CCB6746
MPDIVFAVSLCARFQSDPRESHVAIIKRILCYLKGTNNLCLWYPKNCDFTLVGYTDADCAGYLIDRKSTSGMAQFLGPLSCFMGLSQTELNSYVHHRGRIHSSRFLLCSTPMAQATTHGLRHLDGLN